MKINIQTFANASEYYPKNFNLIIEQNGLNDLIKALIKKNPEADELLKTCRFAINNEFINNDFNINENDNIYILPPSSGG